MKLVLDFETFYDSKTFTLKKQSMLEYVRDPRFKVHGVGFKIFSEHYKELESQSQWITGLDVAIFFEHFDWSCVDVIMHNAKFDGLILKEVYGVQPRSWIDTKGMSRAVFGKSLKNHSLATIAEHFGMMPKGIMKTDGLATLTPEQEKELAEYCLHDVELTALIYSQMEKDFPKNQYEILSQTVQMFVEPKIILDVPLLEKTAAMERERKKTIFEDLGIDKAEFSSNVKFPKLLEKEGFEVPTKISPRTGKQIPAIALGDPDFLDLLEGENERLRTLCEARVAAKSTLLETRSEKLCAIGRTGYWSFDVEYSGANQTHRLSGGKGAGGNPQNFTRGSALREAVCAPSGFALVVGDFSSIELRMVAYLSKDPGLIQAIEEGKDLYCDFASVFFGRPIDKEKDEAEYRFGKCAILGLGYGMGPAKFRKTVRLQTGQSISEEDAERAVELYRTRYGRVPRFWHFLTSQIPSFAQDKQGLIIGTPMRYEKEALILPSGLRIRYPNLRQNLEGEWIYDVWTKRKSGVDIAKLYGGKVLEHMSQGLAGELCKEVARPFGNSVTGLVHDEIHLLALQADAGTAEEELKKAMRQAPAWMPRIKLDAKVGVGPNWLAASKNMTAHAVR